MIGTPEIRFTEPFTLVGMNRSMSVLNMPIADLWRAFGSRKHEISNVSDQDSYSIEVYPGLDYFRQFSPANEFQKWAAVRVNSVDNVPDGMEVLEVPEGKYAVFIYKGRSSEAGKFFQELYNNLLPSSEFQLDGHPTGIRMMVKGYCKVLPGTVQ